MTAFGASYHISRKVLKRFPSLNLGKAISLLIILARLERLAEVIEEAYA